MMNKMVFTFIGFIVISCDFKNDGAIHKINCDNLSEMDVINYPKEIDTLIQNQLNDFYKKDSVEYKILGNVYNSLNLVNCKIDTLTFNAQVRARIDEEDDYWQISYKKIDGKYKNEIFFKRRPPTR